jgi:hypothetical protein
MEKVKWKIAAEEKVCGFYKSIQQITKTIKEAGHHWI